MPEPTEAISEDAMTVVALLSETATAVSPSISYFLAKAAISVAPLLTRSLAPAGNRERSLLVRLGWETGEDKTDAILPAMIAIELLHFSTLVIDDWFDESPQRGGTTSVVREFGPKKAVIAGEILSSAAVRILLDCSTDVVKPESLLAGVRVLERVREDGYVGQLLDLSFESRDRVTEEEYLHMIDLTTGVLTQAAVVLGGTLRDASARELCALERFGRCFGMALQIRNDVSELLGDPAMIGRGVGEDLKRCKKRLPWIHALASGSPATHGPIRRVLGNGDAAHDEIIAAVHAMKEAGSLDHCLAHIVRLRGEAVHSLEALPDRPAKRAMQGLADIVAYCW